MIDFDFDKCTFHFLTSKKKHIGQFGKNVFGYEHKEYTTPIERFSNISSWALDIIHKHKKETAQIYIEGYSFGSKGQAVFQIAENCGILKYRLQLSPTYYMTQLYLVLLKNMRQVKETQINNLCMMLLKNIQNKIY